MANSKAGLRRSSRKFWLPFRRRRTPNARAPWAAAVRCQRSSDAALARPANDLGRSGETGLEIIGNTLGCRSDNNVQAARPWRRHPPHAEAPQIGRPHICVGLDGHAQPAGTDLYLDDVAGTAECV